jgi:hypothetical protein
VIVFISLVCDCDFKIEGIYAKRQSRKRKALPNISIENEAQITAKVGREMKFFSIKI